MSRNLRMLLAAGAGATAPGQEFTSQPPVGTDVKIKPVWKDKGLILTLLPGVNDTGSTMREYVQGLSPTLYLPGFAGPPSTPYASTANGRVIRLDPTNTDGTSAATAEFPVSAFTGTNLTVVWAGYVDGFGPSQGVMFARGADGSGNGWSARMYQASATQLVTQYIDTSPAQITNTLTIPSTPLGTFFVAGFRKAGSEQSTWYGDGSIRSGTGGGNQGLRTSTIGLSIGNAGFNGDGVSGRGGSKTRPACVHFVNTNLVNADMEALCSNVWGPLTT